MVLILIALAAAILTAAACAVAYCVGLYRGFRGAYGYFHSVDLAERQAMLEATTDAIERQNRSAVEASRAIQELEAGRAPVPGRTQ